MTAVMLGSQQFFLKQNRQEHSECGYTPRSWCERAIAVLDSGVGVYRGSQLLHKIFDLIHLLRPNEYCAQTSKVFKDCAKVTVLPHMPTLARDVLKDVRAVSTSTATMTSVVQAIKSVATFTASSVYSTALFTHVPLPAFKAAEALTFTADTCELQLGVQSLRQGYSLAGRVQKMDVEPVFKQSIGETNTLNLLKVCKAVCSVAGFVFGLGLVATGAAMLPGSLVFSAGVSLIATIFATSASFYEEGMRHKSIKFSEAQFVPSTVVVDDVKASENSSSEPVVDASESIKASSVENAVVDASESIKASSVENAVADANESVKASSSEAVDTGSVAVKAGDSLEGSSSAV